MTTQPLTGDVEEAAKHIVPERLPYPPSWIDHLTAWLDRLPVPPWLVYLMLAVTVNLVNAALEWRQGSYPPGTFYPLHVMTIAAVFYYFGLIHYLDRGAEQALVEFRPALIEQSMSYAEIRYRLTTMPARPTWIVTILGIVYGALSSWLTANHVIFVDAVAFTSPITSVVDGLIITLANMALLLFIYHSIHQLALIRRVYLTCTRIDLFKLTPLYAFSRFTAKSALAWLAIGYAWFAAVSIMAVDPFNVASGSVVMLVALATFLVPLLGVHQMLVAEKARAKAETTQRLKAAMDAFHRMIDREQVGEAVHQTQIMAGLKQELEIVEKIPVWPWQPETLRTVISVVLLPILVRVLTLVLERIFAF
jgi:hypothetical protein